MLPGDEFIQYSVPDVMKDIHGNSCSWRRPRQDSPVSDSSDSYEEPYFPSTITVPRMPANSIYGAANICVLECDSTFFELLNLWQTGFLSRTATGVAGALSKRAQAITALALYDECKGNAWLSLMSSYHSALTGNNALDHVQRQAHARAVTSLREKMEHYSRISTFFLANLNTLSHAEFAAGDYETATHHLKFLVDELNPDVNPRADKLIFRLRHSVMIADLERATATFSPPLMDVNTWSVHDQVLEQLESGAQTSTVHFSFSSPSKLDHDALKDVRLIDIFTRVHHFDQIFETFSTSDIVTRSIGYQTSWACLQLCNDILLHSIDLCDVALHYSLPTGKVSEERHLAYINRCQHAAAALALLWYFRLQIRNEHASMRQTPHHALLESFMSKGPVIVKRMQLLMQKSKASADLLLHRQIGSPCSPPNSHSPRSTRSIAVEQVHPALRLRLWLMYVGGWIEAVTWYRPGQERPRFFTEELPELQDAVLSSCDPDLRQHMLDEIFAGFVVLEPCSDNVRTPADFRLKQGPQWLSPVLRTWGFANWDGDFA